MISDSLLYAILFASTASTFFLLGAYYEQSFSLQNILGIINKHPRTLRIRQRLYAILRRTKKRAIRNTGEHNNAHSLDDLADNSFQMPEEWNQISEFMIPGHQSIRLPNWLYEHLRTASNIDTIRINRHPRLNSTDLAGYTAHIHTHLRNSHHHRRAASADQERHRARDRNVENARGNSRENDRHRERERDRDRERERERERRPHRSSNFHFSLSGAPNREFYNPSINVPSYLQTRTADNSPLTTARGYRFGTTRVRHSLSYYDRESHNESRNDSATESDANSTATSHRPRVILEPILRNILIRPIRSTETTANTTRFDLRNLLSESENVNGLEVAEQRQRRTEDNEQEPPRRPWSFETERSLNHNVDENDTELPWSSVDLQDMNTMLLIAQSYANLLKLYLRRGTENSES